MIFKLNDKKVNVIIPKTVPRLKPEYVTHLYENFYVESSGSSTHDIDEEE